jgi:pimeloyl-ACP methyl ester carboxylesterase
VLAAYGPLDTSKPPVVLVHGHRASPEVFKALADELSKAGRQVMIFYYEDSKAGFGTTGPILAREIEKLGAAYGGTGAPIDVIAHSMGGLVARNALNALDGGPGGFSQLSLYAIDTPWEGFAASTESFMRGLVRWVARLWVDEAVVHMLAFSPEMSTLYQPFDRSLVRVRQIMTTQETSFDVYSIPELSWYERAAIGELMVTGAFGTDPGLRARGSASALAEDERYAELQALVRRNWPTDPYAGHDRASVVTEAYERVMPRAVGTHTGVLSGAPGERALSDDLVRRLRLPRAARE